MDYAAIIKVISAIASFLFLTLIPIIVMYVKKYKAWVQAKEEAENAKTEAEKAAADAEAEKIKTELLDLANSLVEKSESAFKQFDTILKAQTGKGCGAMKKESVMTKIQAACIEKGVTFDEEYWDNKIEEIVKLTKKVNAKGA